MSTKLENLINEKIILSNMTDEDYELQSYRQYLLDTYSFINVILNSYQMTQESLDRLFAMALISQAIIIYSIVVY